MCGYTPCPDLIGKAANDSLVAGLRAERGAFKDDGGARLGQRLLRQHQ
jgi:hypothetical protein